MTEWSGVILLLAGKVAAANEINDSIGERKKRLVQLAAVCWAEYQAIDRKEDGSQ